MAECGRSKTCEHWKEIFRYANRLGECSEHDVAIESPFAGSLCSPDTITSIETTKLLTPAEFGCPDHKIRRKKYFVTDPSRDGTGTSVFVIGKDGFKALELFTGMPCQVAQILCTRLNGTYDDFIKDYK